MSFSLTICPMPKSVDTVNEPLVTVKAFEDLLASLHPFAAVLGIEIQHIGFGTATLRLPPNDSNQRLGGMVAGPMLMGLADLALYAAIVGATGNPNAVTASLTINFLRKAPPGGILAHATILKTGRMSAGQVLLVPDQEEAPVAQVISTWSVPRKS